ncbi:hypothetical protein CTAM01_00893 [Colletotrichum tamarilloi]|uniref:Uncharacterized protein n=1 Tax=Colletotrichum tamarilloi TaxID=1209934 RepID=A0ABQ9RSG5_9PEZI|nr:uncharacterized protein CTAM01_00893 [Colletotrichum tamarilloi]KAK1511963.1 hypothetical protein CTAM01_00893 [Colletotrichum tamarilloi]
MLIPLSAREACWRVTGCSSAAHGTTFPPSRTGTSPCARARGHVMHYQSLKRPQKIPRQIANPMFCLAYGYYVILGGGSKGTAFPGRYAPPGQICRPSHHSSNSIPCTRDGCPKHTNHRRYADYAVTRLSQQ